MSMKTQTLLFEDDAEIAFERSEILMHCKVEDPWLGWPKEGSPRYQRWIKRINKIAALWGVPGWDQIRTLRDARKLKEAVGQDNRGLSPLPNAEEPQPNR
jgi:hypothetical protein